MQQTSLTFKTWGGKRKGAGRKRGTRLPHVRRERFARGTPVHVTVRMLPDCAGLRRGPAYAALRAALVRANARGVVRVCHYSLQGNHVHLVCEANDAPSLTRGVRALLISLARRLNALRARRGRVFADRYHAHPLKTPREVRSALSYVLNNWRRHGEHERQRTWHIDPYSSACWFDGWRAPLRAGPDVRPCWLGNEPIPIAPAQYWLLHTGWRRRGLVSHTERPGPS